MTQKINFVAKEEEPDYLVRVCSVLLHLYLVRHLLFPFPPTLPTPSSSLSFVLSSKFRLNAFQLKISVSAVPTTTNRNTLDFKHETRFEVRLASPNCRHLQFFSLRHQIKFTVTLKLSFAKCVCCSSLIRRPSLRSSLKPRSFDSATDLNCIKTLSSNAFNLRVLSEFRLDFSTTSGQIPFSRFNLNLRRDREGERERVLPFKLVLVLCYSFERRIAHLLQCTLITLSLHLSRYLFMFF
jgi:hypothetical protein